MFLQLVPLFERNSNTKLVVLEFLNMNESGIPVVRLYPKHPKTQKHDSSKVIEVNHLAGAMHAINGVKYHCMTGQL